MAYKVINVETGANHGKYDSLELARGCVAFDKLTDWEIWDGDNYCVDSTLDHEALNRTNADIIDGFNRDDLGESPDY